MKNVSLTMSLVALLLASEVRAADVTINWKGTEKSIGSGYLPKSASDGLQNVATVAQTGKGLNALQYEFGSYDSISTPPSVSWAGLFSSLDSPPQTTAQIGHSPSIGLILEGEYPNAENAIEVHQGGQDNESLLWYQLGSSTSGSTGMKWLTAASYDTGYNATVAVDLNGPSPSSATVVEVHQAAVGESALWYHVGTLTLGTSPSMSPNWASAFEINAGVNQGYAPTVSIANNIAVLVAQGASGALWYSIGVVDATASSITWSDLIPYGTTGYNPTVSVFGSGPSLIGTRTVVEAHQVDNGTGSLTYRTGVLIAGPDGSAPTSITWTAGSPAVDTSYATGCYPSVALAFYGYTGSYLSLTETHQTACGAVTTIESMFGFLSK